MFIRVALDCCCADGQAGPGWSKQGRMQCNELKPPLIHLPALLGLLTERAPPACVHTAAGVAMAPVWLPVLAGGALGGLYAALNRLGMKRFWRSPRAPLNVVITGGARGIGKALAREFLRCA